MQTTPNPMHHYFATAIAATTTTQPPTSTGLRWPTPTHGQTRSHCGRTHPYGTSSRVEVNPGDGHVSPAVAARNGIHPGCGVLLQGSGYGWCRTRRCRVRKAVHHPPWFAAAAGGRHVPATEAAPRRRCWWGFRVRTTDGVQANRAHAGVHGAAPCCRGRSRQRTVPLPQAARPRNTHAPRTLTCSHGCRRTRPASTWLPRLPARRR